MRVTSHHLRAASLVISLEIVFVMTHSRNEFLPPGYSIGEGLSYFLNSLSMVLIQPLGLLDDIFNRIRSRTWLRILLDPPGLNLIRFSAHISREFLGPEVNPVVVVLTYCN